MKIVIADDDPIIRTLLDYVLRPTEHKTYIAKDGMEVLDLINVLIPDLIILDIMMPFFTGFQIYDMLEPHPRLRNVPIIFLTTMTQNIIGKRGQQYNKIPVISKPLILSTIVQTIETIYEAERHPPANSSIPSIVGR